MTVAQKHSYSPAAAVSDTARIIEQNKVTEALGKTSAFSADCVYKAMSDAQIVSEKTEAMGSSTTSYSRPQVMPSAEKITSSVSTPAASTLLQVIDENKSFNAALHTHVNSEWDFADCGLDYHALAILGNQSTGKSTILNHVFGTKFPVMEESKRRQTTRGVWMGKVDGENILLLDLEGTDGRERGDDQDFERKSALFALAISEVVVLNMWETTIGLYNSASMPLLRTVLEVNLQLFQRESPVKTHLVFLIRDKASPVPVESLAATIREDLDRIWSTIISQYNPRRAQSPSPSKSIDGKENKDTSSLITPVSSSTSLSSSLMQTQNSNLLPLDEIEIVMLPDCDVTANDDLLSSSVLTMSPSSNFVRQNALLDFDSLFDVSVYALPHYLLMRDKFDAECALLRKRFFDPSDPEYMFRPTYRKNVPADGFATFAQSIWEKIASNKDLDLPTQQELLAQFRCEELSAAARNTFISLCEKSAFAATLAAGQVEAHLGSKLDTISITSMREFDKLAKRYSKHIYSKKRGEALSSLHSYAAGAYFNSQLHNAELSAIARFNRAFDDLAASSPANASKSISQQRSASLLKNSVFLSIADRAFNGAMKYFSEITIESTMDGSDWGSGSALAARARLSEQLRATCIARRAKQAELHMAALESSFVKYMEREIDFLIMNTNPENFASDVQERLTEAVGVTEKRLRDSVIYELKFSREDAQILERKMQAAELCQFRRILEKITAHSALHTRLRKCFETHFRYTSDGIPRIWRDTHDIDGIFSRSRDYALRIILHLSSFSFSLSASELFSLDDFQNSDHQVGAMNSYNSPKKTFETFQDNSQDENTILTTSEKYEMAWCTLECEKEEKKKELLAREAEVESVLAELAEKVFLSETQAAEVAARFKLEADATYMDAKRAVVASSTRVPWWMILALLVLGWNEFVYFLSSPLALTMLLIACVTGLFFYTLGLIEPVWALSLRAIQMVSARLQQSSIPQVATPAYEIGERRQFHSKKLTPSSPSCTASDASNVEDSLFPNENRRATIRP